ncbi:MAG: hypothetical protein JWQ27_531 [Ferruginibacter sp.]|nr:hypothetical protein [Ferruginibacter sp.]
MKIVKLLSLMAFAAVTATSCQDNKKEETTVATVTTPETVPVATVAKTAATEGKSVSITTEQVPDSVRKSFTVKYPKAQKAVWMQYEPIESDDMKMDDQYYYVRFNNNGADYTSWYNNRGEWVKTSTRITGNPNLPDAVNQTINAQYPGYTIVEIDKENDKDRDMYEIELHKGEEKAKLKILPNGEIFKRK